MYLSMYCLQLTEKGRIITKFCVYFSFCCIIKQLGMPSPPNLTPPYMFHRFYGACSESTLVWVITEPPTTYIRHWISVLPQTWWSPTVGWMKASLITTNVLFQRISTKCLIKRNVLSLYQVSALPRWCGLLILANIIINISACGFSSSLSEVFSLFSLIC